MLYLTIVYVDATKLRTNGTAMAKQSIREPIDPSFAQTLSRYVFIERMDQNAKKCYDGAHAMCFLHINNMALFNRLHGVEGGANVLLSVVDLLAGLSVESLVARYAGDGLVFVVPTESVPHIPDLVNAMLPTYGEPRGLVSKVGAVACSFPLSPDDCMERARFSCNMIRKVDGISYCFFEDRIAWEYEKRLYVRDNLDDAISRGEIQAWAQPIVRVLTGRVCEVEVLARWQSEQYGYLFPNEFIPVLEEHRLIHKLDLEVFRLACFHWAHAKRLGINVPFGINLSRLDFEACDIYQCMRLTMEAYGVPVDQVHVEVTESAVAKDDGLMEEGIQRFREAGFQMYMDDFGSGYSSLGQMASMDFDVIKIDKGLLDHVVGDVRARAVLADTVALVKRLGMQTLCEGVETEEQYAFLKAIGCEKAQGYYFGKPEEHSVTFLSLHKLADKQEDESENAYLDAVGKVNLIEGISSNLHGVEAATVLGRHPVAVLEIRDGSISQLSCNTAFQQLMKNLGYGSFQNVANKTTSVANRVRAQAIQAATEARETGTVQVFDCILQGVFCSVAMEFVAKTAQCEAYLTSITSVQNAPQVTEHVLLEGVLETSHLCFFWKDTNRRFLGANQRFLDYYGFSGVEVILGKTDEDMGWNSEEEPFQQDEMRVLQGTTISEAHGVCMCRGEYRDIVATKRPLYSRGAIVGLVGFFEDIGPHKF